MPDITMCANSECPNASSCYRVMANPSNWQSVAMFEYTVSESGDIECEYYIEMAKKSA